MEKSIHTPRYRALIDWLKKNRKEQGYSLRDLEEKVGFTNSTISKIERYEKRLDIEEFLRFCDVLGIDPSEGISLVNKYPR